VINLYRSIFIILVLLISYLAFIPSQGGSDIPYLDKVFHFLAFFILMTFLDLSTTRPLEVHFDLISCLFLFALGIEIVQYNLPYRSAELFDLLADLLGMVVYFVFIPRIKV
jgi:VanZ family protein